MHDTIYYCCTYIIPYGGLGISDIPQPLTTSHYTSEIKEETLYQNTNADMLPLSGCVNKKLILLKI